MCFGVISVRGFAGWVVLGLSAGAVRCRRLVVGVCVRCRGARVPGRSAVRGRARGRGGLWGAGAAGVQQLGCGGPPVE